jgi:transposase
VKLEHETRPDILKKTALVLAKENERLVAEVVRLRRENLELRGAAPEVLQQELALLDEQLRRATAAVATAQQAAVEPPASSDDASNAKPPKKKHPGHGPKAQPKLAVIEELHDLDEADKQCPACGGGLKHVEGLDDVTEEIDVIERRFVITKRVRPKYRCACGGCMEMADLPPRLVPGGRYSNDFAIEIAAMKFIDQLPFERIARILGREGLDVDSQTLWDQVERLAQKLRPGWERLRVDACAEAVVGIDQTSWKIIGHAKTWQMWELSTPSLAYFAIAEAKGTKDGLAILNGFRGTLACDAATTHGALSRVLNVKLAFCWAHAVRMVRAASTSDPIRAEHLRKEMRRLYDVEDEAGGDLERLRVLRDSKSRIILDDLGKWLLQQRMLPSAPMAEAIAYIANHWTGLRQFLEDPRIPIDNSLTERGYLWPAIGRRSFTGSKSKRGTEVAALFYSLIETARRCGVEPKDYLRRALAAALDDTKLPVPLPYDFAGPRLAPASRERPSGLADDAG